MTTQLHFTEEMKGFFSIGAATFSQGRERGHSESSRLLFHQTIQIADLDAVMRDTATPAVLTGYVEAPALSSDPLIVSNGAFQLMAPNPDDVETLNMRYGMDLTATDGRRFHFDGFKTLRHGLPWKAWPATTTLYVTITEPAPHAEGEASERASAVVGRGVMTIGLFAFLKLLSTVRVDGLKGRRPKMRAMIGFSRVFMGRLVPEYGGPFAEKARFANPAPSGRRALRLPAPVTMWCDANGAWHDGDQPGRDAWLMLTRFQGGTKGPLLMAGGYAMEGRAFATPTIDNTMTEYAFERGYDVWLFDYRASIRLPSASTSFTIDDIARHDWPEAVAEVRRRTNAESVQLLGHCVGSVTILMAMADGLESVRSAVCSQFTLHVVTSRLNRAKNALHMGALMHALHLKVVHPNTRPTALNKVFDAALAVLPQPKGERCNEPVCRWINAIFGLTHNHGQLNDATHESLREAFGFANLTGLRHLSRMFVKGQAVDAKGNDTYLAHPERLNVPILFVQGARNHIFRPAGTARTVEWLGAHNPPEQYKMIVVPEYAHLDTMIGKNADKEVFPQIFDHLDRFNPPVGSAGSVAPVVSVARP